MMSFIKIDDNEEVICERFSSSDDPG